MTSIIEQYDDELAPSKSEEAKSMPSPKSKSKSEKEDEELEEKREQLCMLATLGTISEYAGCKLSLGDVKRLPPKDVKKYYNRYQTATGAKMANGLMNVLQGIAVGIISRILPIDDKKELNKDLENDKFLRKSLSNDVGFVALKGGRFIALAYFLFQVGKHIKTDFFGASPQFLEPAEQLVKEFEQYLSKT